MKETLACALMIACLFRITACSQSNGAIEDAQDTIVNRTFIYENEGFGGEHFWGPLNEAE